jgi:ribonuclease T2
MSVSLSALICFTLCLIAIAYAALPIRNMAGKQYVLAMQRCKGSSTWTLHGLWPEWAQDCKGTPFSEKALEPIRPEMESLYRSCPEFGKTNLDFWDHEWSKHGTCYAQRWNQTQVEYFVKALDLREELSKMCSPTLTGECRLGLDANLKPI